ncbi:cupin domain-containing protein [Acidocella sp.]|uniref:cupin domain-containing protein n=1 Tax=Acidocella sp. TaxID=50710 RepID=UPI0026248695|nr:cupin domain-containing protein [Acidocella sp.]
MLDFKLDMDRMPLDDWGTPENIGAVTVEGAVKISGKLLFGTLETPVSGGIYAATQGKYRVTYPFHEHATLLDGELAITDETSGKTVVYGPGDSWIIAKGATVLWHIRSPHIRKTYLAAAVEQ